MEKDNNQERQSVSAKAISVQASNVEYGSGEGMFETPKMQVALDAVLAHWDPAVARDVDSISAVADAWVGVSFGMRMVFDVRSAALMVQGLTFNPNLVWPCEWRDALEAFRDRCRTNQCDDTHVDLGPMQLDTLLGNWSGHRWLIVNGADSQYHYHPDGQHNMEGFISREYSDGGLTLRSSVSFQGVGMDIGAECCASPSLTISDERCTRQYVLGADASRLHIEIHSLFDGTVVSAVSSEGESTKQEVSVDRPCKPPRNKEREELAVGALLRRALQERDRCSYQLRKHPDESVADLEVGRWLIQVRRVGPEDYFRMFGTSGRAVCDITDSEEHRLIYLAIEEKSRKNYRFAERQILLLDYTYFHLTKDVINELCRCMKSTVQSKHFREIWLASRSTHDARRLA